MSEPQSTNQVMMIRPVRFVGNVQTKASNAFQQHCNSITSDDVQSKAQQEFDHLVNLLRNADIDVSVFQDTPEPHTPDSVFPNNWVSFHSNGTVVLYPMLAENRRLERRMDVIEELFEKGFQINRMIDLTHYEQHQKYLEGTGSMVLDRINRVAYACISPRTDLDVLREFAQQLNYELISFDATDSKGVAIYHTNVLMCVGSAFAVVCVEVIAEQARRAVLDSLAESGREVIEITEEQMQAFAGNMLELKTSTGELRLALSQSAYDALSAVQRTQLESLSGELLVASIPTIERHGGGSVRCMLAEIFLPHKPAAA
jgi:hypothetical protein